MRTGVTTLENATAASDEDSFRASRSHDRLDSLISRNIYGVPNGILFGHRAELGGRPTFRHFLSLLFSIHCGSNPEITKTVVREVSSLLASARSEDIIGWLSCSVTVLANHGCELLEIISFQRHARFTSILLRLIKKGKRMVLMNHTGKDKEE